MKTLKIIGVIAALIFLLFAVLHYRRAHHVELPELIQSTKPASVAASSTNEIVLAARHPVHPGGVKNAADLYMLLRNDPAVAAHYASIGFDLQCMNQTALPVNVWGRVSYRTANGFAFTKAPILLLAGTPVIEDCHGNMIRMGCANLIVTDRQPAMPSDNSMTAELQPFDAPGDDLPFPAPSSVTPDTPIIIAPPVLPPTSGPLPPIYTGCCFVIIGGGAPSPVKTSEPGGVALIAVGFIGLLLLKLRDRS